MDTEIMQTIYEASGGFDALLRLAHAWHTRVLEDEVVSHAFSHGYHPSTPNALQRTGRRHSVAQQRTPTSTVMKHPSCGFTAATARTRRWTSERSPVSIRPCKIPDSAATSDSGASCTITSRGQPRPRCLVTTTQRTMCRTVCTSRSGPGTDSLVVRAAADANN